MRPLDTAIVAASPSRPLLLLCSVLVLLVALVSIVPTLLLLGSIVGLVPADLNIVIIALPTLVVAGLFGLTGASLVRDLLLPQPVLLIGPDGIFDRRVADSQIAWSDVTRATALLNGRNGVVLDLNGARQTRLDPFRIGSTGFERTGPGVAHLPLRLMSRSPSALADAILSEAARHGIEVGQAVAHPALKRTKLLLP